jgi:hypothetical protein
MNVFEAAGLGKAPYKLHGCATFSSNVGGGVTVSNPGGTCALCGQFIKTKVNFSAASGEKFHVGVDCAKKAFANSDKAKKMIMASVKKEEQASDISKIDAIINCEDAKSIPHPSIPSKNYAEYCVWIKSNAGAAGIKKAVKMFKKTA